MIFPNQRVKKILFFLLKFVISGIAIYLVIQKTDFQQVADIIGKSKLFFLLLAILFFGVSKILSSVRLNMYLHSIGIELSEWSNLKLYLLGMYYNLFLPGGIGGDGYKVFQLNRLFKIKGVIVAKAIIFDRVTGLLALFWLMIGLSFILPLPQIYKGFLWIFIPLSFWIFRFISKKFLPEFNNSLNRGDLLSLGVQVCQLISVYFILIAIHQNESVLAYLFIFLVSSVIAVIPITIGGIGARELTFLYGAELLFLDSTVSVTISIIFFLITAFVSLSGIIFSFTNPLKKEQTKVILTNADLS